MSESALRRRGVTRASLTCLAVCFQGPEGRADQPNTFDLAQQIQHKEELKSDFMARHTDVLTDDGGLAAEQEILMKMLHTWKSAHHCLLIFL